MLDILHPSGWIAVQLQNNISIPHSLDTTPFQIKTERETESKDPIFLKFLDQNDAQHGGITIRFNPTPRYRLRNCHPYEQTEFDPAPPRNPVKVWTIIKLPGPPIKVIVRCNDVEVLNTEINNNTCPSSIWMSRWHVPVAAVQIGHSSKGADFYRAGERISKEISDLGIRLNSGTVKLPERRIRIEF